MTTEPRRCDHNTSTSHIDDQTICDGCEAVIESTTKGNE